MTPDRSEYRGGPPAAPGETLSRARSVARLFPYLLYLSVFFAYLCDNGAFGPVIGRAGAGFFGLVPIVLLLALLVSGRFTQAFRRACSDPFTALLFFSGLALIALQLVSNSRSGWTPIALKEELYWLSGVGTVLLLSATSAAGLLQEVRMELLAASFCAGQAVNLAFALFGFPQLLEHVGTGLYYSGGSVKIGQLFSVVCTFSAIICANAASMDFFRRRGLPAFMLGISLLSAFFIPTSGSRTGTVCFLLMLMMWGLSLRKKTAMLPVLLAYLCGSLLMFSLHNPRELNIDNPSTVARIFMYRTDMWIIASHPWVGIGMDLGNYQEYVRSSPYFAAFSVVDPWVAQYPIPHSWTLEIVVQSGVLAGALFLLFAFSASLLVWRSSGAVSEAANWARVLLLAYLVINAGLLFHPLNDSFQWILLASAFASVAVSASVKEQM